MLNRRNLIRGLSIFSGTIYATSLIGARNVGAVKLVDEVRKSLIDFFEYLPNYNALSEEEKYFAKAILIAAKSKDVTVDYLIYLYNSASVIYNFAKKRKEDEKNKDVPLVDWISLKVYKFINFPVTFYYYFFQKNPSDKIYEEAQLSFFETMTKYKDYLSDGKVDGVSKEMSKLLIFGIEEEVSANSLLNFLNSLYFFKPDIQWDSLKKLFNRIVMILDHNYSVDKIREENIWSLHKTDAFDALKGSLLKVSDEAIKKGLDGIVSFKNVWDYILKDNRIKDLCAMLKELDDLKIDFSKNQVGDFSVCEGKEQLGKAVLDLAEQSIVTEKNNFEEISKIISNYLEMRSEQEKNLVNNLNSANSNRIDDNVGLPNRGFGNEIKSNNGFSQLNNSAAPNRINDNSVNSPNINFSVENSGNDNSLNHISNSVNLNQNQHQANNMFRGYDPNRIDDSSSDVDPYMLDFFFSIK